MERLNCGRLALVGAIVLLVVAGGWKVLDVIKHSAFFRSRAHVHQLTGYLVRDEKEFGRIGSIKQAIDAQNLLWCIENRYVLDPKFNFSSETRSKFEGQKSRTINTIINAMKEFTGEDYGNDVENWQEWWCGVDEPNTFAGGLCFQARYHEAMRVLPEDMAKWDKFTALTGSTMEGAAGFMHHRVMSDIAMKGDAEWGKILDDPNIPHDYKTEMMFEIMEQRLGKGSVYFGDDKSIVIPRLH